MSEASPISALKPRWLDAVSDISAARWDRLFPSGNPFLRHDFLRSLEESGSADTESGWQPRHLVIERDGKSVAALPLYLKSHSYGEFVFDWAWAEAWARHGLAYYPKLLTAVPFCPSVGPRLGILPGEDGAHLTEMLLHTVREEARQSGLSGWHMLFPDEASRKLALQGPQPYTLLQRQGVQFHFHNRDFADFDDFLGSLRSKRRKNIRKERRRVEAQGVVLERQVGDAIERSDWDAFYRCYVSTFLKRSGHGGYLTRAFFEQLLERMPEQLMLVVARQENAVVAGALFLFDDERLFGRWWGALTQIDCLHFETCFYQGMEFCIERGLSIFDPGTQGEHKLLRGFEPVTTHSLHYITDERFRMAISNYLNSEEAHTDAYVERAETFLPFRRDQSATENTGGTTRPGRGGRNTSGSS